MHLNALSIWPAALTPLLLQLILLVGQQPNSINWSFLNLAGFIFLAGLLWRSDRQGRRWEQQHQRIEQSLQQAMAELQQARTELQRSEQRFCSLVQQVPVAVMRIALDGTPPSGQLCLGVHVGSSARHRRKL